MSLRYTVEFDSRTYFTCRRQLYSFPRPLIVVQLTISLVGLLTAFNVTMIPDAVTLLLTWYKTAETRRTLAKCKLEGTPLTTLLLRDGILSFSIWWFNADE